MISFILGIVLLFLGYFIYGKIVEKMFGVDANRPTPATTMADGVDYVPMKPWRIYLIQFLNIAGVGPICGAIMGAKFGTASFLWIVFGTIFGGAVHDYLSGMISLRRKGCGLPDIYKENLNEKANIFFNFFTIFMLILVGIVFVNTPATLLNSQFTPDWNIFIWIVIIMAYYMLATLVPIDKLIGKIYPVFGILLLMMAAALVVAFILYQPAIPELWDGLQNKHPQADTNPIFPMMFISIACGAISGFHATQSPLMARCMTNEKQGRPIFYGAMITEGIVALIWAAAAAYFYGPDGPVDTTGQSGPAMVGTIAKHWFTPAIAVITILGVISAAITSGDTALRSARLVLADVLHFDQKPIWKRLAIAIPLFAAVTGGLIYSLKRPDRFDIIWYYFAWANQVLAAYTLWAITHYLAVNGKKLFAVLTTLPAIFMTMVTTSFLFVTDKGLGAFFPHSTGYALGGIVTFLALMESTQWYRKHGVITKEKLKKLNYRIFKHKKV